MELLYVLYYEMRRAINRERVYKDPLDPLHISDQDLLMYYRFPRCELISMIRELDPYLRRRTRRSHALPTSTQLLVALRFYASGTFQNVLASTAGMTQASVSRTITRVTMALFRISQAEIKMPSSVLLRMKAMQEFAQIANFPRVIGVIDGTHVPIKAPAVDEPVFVNRKQFHSMNMQVVCDAKQRIISHSCRYPGSTHDSFIWRNSDLCTRFQNDEFGDGLLLGDSGYPLEPYLMTPFANPSTPAEEAFNKSHKKTRVIVEQCFGVLKSRFRCLHKSGGSLQYNPAKCAYITIACFLLHNRCIDRKIPLIGEDDDFNILLEEEIDIVEEGEIGRRDGRETRDEIANNFFV